MADELYVGARVDLSAVNAGMTQMRVNAQRNLSELQAKLAETVTFTKGAFKQLGEATAAGMSPEAIKVYDDAVNESIEKQIELKSQVEAAREAFDRLTPSVNNNTVALSENRMASYAARIGLRDMGLNAGIAGRAVGALAAQSETLGPILAAAFPAFLVVAFGEALVRVIPKIREFFETLSGETEWKAAIEEYTERTRKLRIELLQVESAHRKVAEIGKEGVAKQQIALEAATADAEAYHKALQGDRGAGVEGETQKLEKLQERLETIKRLTSSPFEFHKASEGIPFYLDKDDVKKAEEAVKKQQAFVDQLTSHKMAADREVDKARAELSVANVKRAEEETKAIIEAGRKRDESIATDSLAFIKLYNEQLQENAKTSLSANEELYSRTEGAAAETYTNLVTLINKERDEVIEANNRKLAADHAYFDAKKAEARAEEAATKKPAGPEIAKLNAEEEVANDQTALKNVQAQDKAEREIIKLHQQGETAIEKILEEEKRKFEETMRGESEAAHKALEEQQRDIEKRVRLSKELADDELRLYTDLYTNTQIKTKGAYEAQIAAIEAWRDKQKAVLEQAAQDELRLQGKETDQYKEYERRKELVAQEAAKKIEDIEKQAAKEVDKYWEQASNNFFNALNQMIQKQKTAAQAMREMWNAMVMDIIKDIEKMAQKWIEEHIIMALINRIFGDTTSDQSAEQVAKNNAKNVAMASSDAAAAAGAAFESVMIALPFPANVSTAPEIAAAVLATGLGFAAAASAAQGGVVPINAHAGEMILPAHISSWVQRAASGNTGSGGAGHPIHIHMSNTINHPMTPDDINNHADQITRAVKQRLGSYNM